VTKKGKASKIINFPYLPIYLDVPVFIGGGSIYKVGGPDAERRRCQRDGEGLRGGVRNFYQLFIWK